MPTVQFKWDPQLIDVRRVACPRARWDAARHAWRMTEREAQAFVAASHQRLDFVRSSAEIVIDSERWIIGFVQGAPCRLAPAKADVA